jgi:hypothetical protein
MEKSRKMIKRDLLDKFREMGLETDNTLSPIWLRKDYIARLNSYEKKVFEEAIGDLVSSGLVEYSPGVFPKVQLTLKGEQLIHY